MSYPITDEAKRLMQQAVLDAGSKTALAKSIGIRKQELHKYLSGTTKSVQMETWIKIMDFFPELDTREYDQEHVKRCHLEQRQCPFQDASRIFKTLIEELLEIKDDAVYIEVLKSVNDIKSQKKQGPGGCHPGELQNSRAAV